MALLDRTFPLLGRRFPAAAGLIMVLTLLGSILVANSRAAALVLALFPGAVLEGQAWRLLTWVFATQDPGDLLFWGLLFFFVGGDLVYAWKPRRFLLVYAGLSVATGLVLLLLSLVLTPLALQPFLTPWPLADALVVAWGLLYADREMLFMFVLPLRGRQLVLVTFGLVAIFAAMQGFWPYLAHFTAMVLMLAYLRERAFETLWLKLRYRWLQLRSGRRRTHLRAVERDDDPQPPRWVH